MFTKQSPTEEAMQLTEKSELRSQKQLPTEEAIQTWLISYLSELLLIDPQEIDVRRPLDNYRLDSAEVFGLTGDLEDLIGHRLSPKLVYEYPTIEKLARHLAEESAR